MEFVYVEATVDGAAGGHTALRLGDDVFHFQYHPGGLFLLVNDAWDDFRFLYNDLNSRSMSVTRVPLPPDSYQKLRSAFFSRYVLQEHRLRLLEQLTDERRLLERLAAGESLVELETLGLFAASGAEPDPHAVELLAIVTARHGADRLRGSLQGVAAEIDALPAPTGIERQEGSGEPPPGTAATPWSVRLRELLQLREALALLLEARPLAGDALVVAEGDGGPVSDPEREALEAFRGEISDSVTAILASNRPDRGADLLLQMARYQAVCRSLASGVLQTLDPFSDRAKRFPLDAMPAEAPHLARLVREAADAVTACRSSFLASPDDRAMAYSRIEASRGRLQELERSARHEGPARIEEGSLLPRRSRAVAVPLPASPKAHAQAARAADANARRYREWLEREFRFNLFTRNCTTEIVRMVDRSLEDGTGEERQLAARLEPGERFTFVPFRLASLAGEVYPGSEVRFLPSWRRRQLERLYGERGYAAWLRESNTLTSSLYEPWPESDTIFLFFTDDVAPPRPLLGALNLAYAAAHTVGGLLMAPVDRGAHLEQALRGMLFSLPELAFFNIRKGTFSAAGGGTLLPGE